MAEDRNPELDAALIKRAEAETRKLDAETALQQASLEWTQKKRKDDDASAYEHGLFSFNTEVGVSSVSSMITVLGDYARREPGSDITIIFNSPGGGVFPGLALFDYIQTLRASGHKVTTQTIGMAASMGGILLQAGDERVAGANSYMLIHEVSSGGHGKTSDLEDNLKFSKRLQDRLLGILAERSTLSVRQIRTHWVKKDWWLDSDEMLKLGFVDRIQ